MEIERILIKTGKKGRPVNESSTRQQKLAKQSAKKETGEPTKLGRPPVATNITEDLPPNKFGKHLID